MKQWRRGHLLGHGTFSSVHILHPCTDSVEGLSSCGSIPANTLLAAVKSCPSSCSATLLREADLLSSLPPSPHIVRHLGLSFTFENGISLCNLLLEYAADGNLANLLKKFPHATMPDPLLRHLTRAIVSSLRFIHANGMVHCDVKPHNLLLFPPSASAVHSGYEVKLADFGLARKMGEEQFPSAHLRGTPMYMSPETVATGECGAAADVWALGCTVVELASGKPPWPAAVEDGVAQLMLRIGEGKSLPEIHEGMMEEGKDFLRRCLVRDPGARWTADMLASHPFVCGGEGGGSGLVKWAEALEECRSPSPRAPFDFPSRVRRRAMDKGCSPSPLSCCPWLSTGLCKRIAEVAAVEEWPDWSAEKGWVTVRMNSGIDS